MPGLRGHRPARCQLVMVLEDDLEHHHDDAEKPGSGGNHNEAEPSKADSPTSGVAMEHQEDDRDSERHIGGVGRGSSQQASYEQRN
jgi:hypothetical protein